MQLARFRALISGITLMGDLKLRITFPEAGVAYYSMYLENGDGNITELRTAAAAAILFRELIKSMPQGRRFAPGF